MIASDPVVTLRELRRVTVAGGRIVTALWAPVDANPWFALPRAAAAVVGPERADYARASVASTTPSKQRRSIAPPGSLTCERKGFGKRSRSRAPPPSGSG